MFLTKLLRTKCTTPKLALTFETGMLPMKDGVAVKKLCLVNDLGFGRKEYFKTIAVEEARMAFQIVTAQLNLSSSWE